MPGLIQELKRRNVVRVGIACLVGAWLLVQGADLLLDIIGAEAWVQKLKSGNDIGVGAASVVFSGMLAQVHAEPAVPELEPVRT